MDKEFLTVKDIAEILDITERTARELFNKGILKGKKIANKHVTTKDLLKQYIEESE